MAPTLASAASYHADGVIAAPVLVVEDDEMLADMLVMLLEAEGYTTALARDGETAIKLARQLRPSLITLDLQLPILTGQGVLKQLAAHRYTRHIPVIIFSSDVSELCPTHQVKRVLVKPDGITELVDAIRGLIPDVPISA